MDPITIAIVSALTALTAGISSGLTEAAKATISDAYQGLKSLINKKIGDKSEVITSIEVLEAKPKLVGQLKETLNEEIVDAQLAQDQDILQAAHSLLSLIKTKPDGERFVQQIIGNLNASSVTGPATVNFNTPNQP